MESRLRAIFLWSTIGSAISAHDSDRICRGGPVMSFSGGDRKSPPDIRVTRLTGFRQQAQADW
jgi:hypothetical protein